jgi:hypothetical protein
MGRFLRRCGGKLLRCAAQLAETGILIYALRTLRFLRSCASHFIRLAVLLNAPYASFHVGLQSLFAKSPDVNVLWE